MALVTVHAGHGGVDPGAVANNRQEAQIARLYSNTIVHMTGVHDATDNSAKSVNENLANIVRNVESVKGSGYDISLHMNASTPQATGVEVFAFGKDKEAMALAGKISADLAKIYGIPDRGAKDGSDLYVIRNTTRPMLLIELGFITNANDLFQVVDKITPACESIVKNLNQPIQGGGSNVTPPTNPNDPKRNFAVEISPFNEGESLDKLKEFRKAFPSYSAKLVQMPNGKQYKIMVQPFNYLEVNGKLAEIKAKFKGWSMKVAEVENLSKRKSVVISPFSGEEGAERFLEIKKALPSYSMRLTEI